MASPRVTEFELDDDNEDKFAAHGLTGQQVNQVIYNHHVIIKNRRARRAPYMLIGHDNGGTCIAIPIRATAVPGRWRPVTAWRCKPQERARLDAAPNLDAEYDESEYYLGDEEE